MMNHSKKLRVLALVSTITFFIFLIWSLYFKFGLSSTIAFQHNNLHQFTGYERFMLDFNPFVINPLHPNKVEFLIEVFLNCMVTAPLGVMLNVIDKRPKIWKHLLIVLLFSLFIETTQFCTLIGGFATLDIIMNVLGYLVGFAVYHLIIKRLPERVNVALFSLANALLLAATVCAIITIIDMKNLLIDIFSENHLETIPWK